MSQRGIDAGLVSKARDPDVRAYVERSGAPARWLESDQTGADLELTAAVARELGADVIVTDLDHPQARARIVGYHRDLRKIAFCLAIVADAPPLDVDVLVIPYVGAAAPPVARGTRCLAGPEYFILRPDFAALRGARAPAREQADRVLVSLGGSDPGRSTSLVIAALAESGMALDVRILIGASFAADHARDVVAAAHRHGFTTLRGEELGQALVWCDLFISADGLTKYEAAALGAPTLVIRAPETETELSGRFQQGGSAMYVPGERPTIADIALSVRRLLDDAVTRAEMSLNGPSLVDGRGGERILASLPL